MARRVNSKCLACAQLSVEAAQQVHGTETGDGCWDDRHCHQRRSHYRHRGDRNALRQITRRQTVTTEPEVIRFSLAVQPTASVVLVIYSDHPHDFKADTPIHGIGAELWVGKQRQVEMEPILCLGWRGDQVVTLLPKILEEFSQQFAASCNQGKPFLKFALRVHRHIQDCPGINLVSQPRRG